MVYRVARDFGSGHAPGGAGSGQARDALPLRVIWLYALPGAGVNFHFSLVLMYLDFGNVVLGVAPGLLLFLHEGRRPAERAPRAGCQTSPTSCGRISLIEPRSTACASSSISVGPPFTIATRAPSPRASGTTPAIG